MAGLFGSSAQATSTTENKIGTLRIQNSSQGLPVPIIFGKTRVTSNLLWYGDFTANPQTTDSTSGGKGGGGQASTSTTYTYTTGVIFGICEGPVFQSNFVGQVWSDKDATDPTALGLTLFTGGYAQAPWSYLTTNHADQALNYRGDCYLANGAFELGDSDGLPNLSFEVTGLLGDGDVNPADVLTALLTNDKFGVGWPLASLGDLSQFAAYCAAAGFLISPAYVAQVPCSQMLTDLLQIGNSDCIWSDGLLKIVPYADTPVGSFAPDLTIQYDLGYSDFLCDTGVDPIKLDRSRQADAYNQVSVECLDGRSGTPTTPAQYNIYVAQAQDQLAVETYGPRPMEQISAHAICDINVARKVAQAVLQRQLYVRNVYTFTLGWRYCRLEPMDCVSLTDANLGLAKQPVRIITIEEDENGQLQMTAEELNIGTSTPGTYVAQGGSGATPANNTPPGNAAVPVMFQPPIALSGSPQIWIGTAGGPNWGGAEIWASNDNATFQRVGQVTNPARFGTLTANFPAGVDPDTTNTLAVDLTASSGVLSPGSNAVADALGTMSYVAGNVPANDEIIAYSTANLTAAFKYSMGGYLRRGQSGSASVAHLTGANFMRLDDAVAAFDVAPSLFGTTIYVKLLSYNTTGGGKQALPDVVAYPYVVQTQVVTSGAGYPFYADRTSTANSDPGNGNVRFNNASQALATQVYFDNLSAQGANMSAYFSSVGSAGFLDLRDVADTNKWATYTITGSNTPAGYHTFNVAFKAGGAEFPNGDTLVATFSPTPPTGVTSVGLSMPALFTVANSPITGAGVLGVTLATQNAAVIFAGPATGNAAQPTFRALALSDFPTAGAATGQVPTFNGSAVVWANQSGGNGGGNGGGIGSIALNMPATVFTVANSPLTANGTLAVTLASQAPNAVFAGPATGNASNAPAFRALVAADVPFVLSNPMTTTGDVIVAGAAGVPTRLPMGANGTFLGVAAGVVGYYTPPSGNGGGGGFNNPMTAAGDIIIGGAAGAAQRLPIGANGQVLGIVAGTLTYVAQSGGNGGGGATSNVVLANVALGNIPAAQLTFNYTNVPNVCARGFMSLLTVTSNVAGLFDLVIRGAGNDSASLYLQANGIAVQSYSASQVIFVANDLAAQDLWVGVRNRGPLAASFNLQSLRVEKTA